MNTSIRSLLLIPLLLWATPAASQSSPGLIFGKVPTPAEWNSYFAAKQDTLGYIPLNSGGGVMTGPLITAASTTAGAGLNCPQGTAPTTPNNGDIWCTSAGMFVQIAGGTVGPLGTGGGGGGTPGGSNGQVQFNNSGSFGGLTNTQLTADINVATASLSGALPAWPNNTTTFLRGDGTYAAVPTATTSVLGVVKPDGSSIMISAGVISAPGSGGGLVSSCAQNSVGAWLGAGTTSTINCLTPAANAILVTNGSSVPSLGTTLPTGIAINASNVSWSGTLPGGNQTAANLASAANGGVTGLLPVANLAGSASGMNQPLNLNLNATISGNALTITLKDQTGATPSASSPVLFEFNSTSNSAPVNYQIANSATSITIPAGATLGQGSGEPFRVWIFAASTGSGVVLGVATCSVFGGVASPTVFPCSAWELGKNGTAITSGSNSSGVFYTPASAAYQVRIIGFVEYIGGLASAGTWNALPTGTYVFSPGMKKPGDVVQSIMVVSSASVNISNSTTKVVAGGTQVNITPTSAINLMRLTASGQIMVQPNGNVGAVGGAQIFRGSAAAAVGNFSAAQASTGVTSLVGASMFGYDFPATNTNVTYSVYIYNTAAIASFNTTWLPTTVYSQPASTGVIEAQEIMGALEPANDNQPMSAVG